VEQPSLVAAYIKDYVGLGRFEFGADMFYEVLPENLVGLLKLTGKKVGTHFCGPLTSTRV
jgi:hypothetical protein